MSKIRTLQVVPPLFAVAACMTLVPAAQAESPKPSVTNASASAMPVEASNQTRIEYRSMEDQEAFEKFGHYISYDSQGIATANIPAKDREANSDLAGRIDEFVMLSNATVDPEGHALMTPYGNETKVENAGPIVKVYISHDVISKVNKVIGAGGGVAGVVALLASEGLAGPAGWVAAGLTALAAASNLCDWNDQGIVIWQNPVPVVGPPFICTPQS